MFFALDQNNNRVNAEDGEFKQCVCPACRKPVIQKRGDTNRHHFAHLKKEASCPFGYNKDYINMSEWHIRMQEYFPKEEREHIFTDKATGEKHIADVFIKEANTVLEFQYSSIKKQEFFDRTYFHLKEGRRLVWLFFEGWKDDNENSYNRQFYKNGKLVKIRNRRVEEPYKEKCYRWMYRRKFVEEGPNVYQKNYSVCVFTDAEGDIFHRIISLDGENIIVSLHDITMSNDLDPEEFFYCENNWNEQEARKDEFEYLEKEDSFPAISNPIPAFAGTQHVKRPNIFDKQPSEYTRQNIEDEDSDEYRKRYYEYEDLNKRIERAKEKISLCLQDKKCPSCGGKLILRNGKYGPFYGCSNYPNCKFTHNVEN